jgi:GAF domain-containing protein
MANLSSNLEKLNQMLLDFSNKGITEQALLDGLCQFCVENLDAVFARIWLVDKEKTELVLKASQGQYTSLTGTRSRIKIGQGSKIDNMYVSGESHISNDVANDPAVVDKEWVKKEGLVAFAGYPLIWNQEKLGVAGLYSRQNLNEETLLVLGTFGLIASMLIYQTNQSELEKERFCEAAGIERKLLDQMISLGQA